MGVCHVALCNIYAALFPLDEKPQGIFGLAKKFSKYDKAKVLVRRQLVRGAKFALAVANTHYPRMDYSLTARCPKAPPGRQRVSMTARYEATNSAAVALMYKPSGRLKLKLLEAVFLPAPECCSSLILNNLCMLYIYLNRKSFSFALYWCNVSSYFFRILRVPQALL